MRTTPTLLLIDDNPDDRELARLALAEAGSELELKAVSSGQEGLDYLFGRGRYQTRSKHEKPAFVLLDLKMPKLDGFAVLRAIRADPSLKDLLVVVLSTSGEAGDRKMALELGADFYRSKPLVFKESVQLMRELLGFCRTTLKR